MAKSISILKHLDSFPPWVSNTGQQRFTPQNGSNVSSCPKRVPNDRDQHLSPLNTDEPRGLLDTWAGVSDAPSPPADNSVRLFLKSGLLRFILHNIKSPLLKFVWLGFDTHSCHPWATAQLNGRHSQLSEESPMHCCGRRPPLYPYPPATSELASVPCPFS